MAKVNRERASLVGCCALIGLVLNPAQAAIVIDGYDTLVNDRFANDPSFLLVEEDLSAIGRANSRWGTLISPNVIISAEHFHPTVNGSVLKFHQDNVPNGPSEQRRVIADQRLGDSDLWVGILESDLPEEYSPLPFATEEINSVIDFNSSSYSGETVYLIGHSPTIYSGATNMAAGVNVLEFFTSSVTVSGVTDVALGAIQHLNGDSDFVAHEAYLQPGDSGGPLIHITNGQPTVIGINWFIAADAIDIDPSPMTEDMRSLSGFAYVGNYATEIQEIIDAFAGNSGADYGTWRDVAFSGVSELAQTGPNIDYDLDGKTNFDEYALSLDPTDPNDFVGLTVSTAEVNNSEHGEITVRIREAGDVTYSVMVGNDLSGWSNSAVTFSGGSWSTDDALIATVVSETDEGDGSWTVTIRDATALASGNPRFISIEYL
ncbi:MAG: trypsin-like peptidase domain-containing protein [Verrucomicrobiota bacterium]